MSRRTRGVTSCGDLKHGFIALLFSISARYGWVLMHAFKW